MGWCRVLLACALWPWWVVAAPPPVVLLAIDGPIGPAAAEYVHGGIEKATQQGAQLVVIRIDTPGGLDTSMRAIIKDILAAPIPISSFVAPSGARAASAGTYILYASHIAAMAPATNVGAATPIRIGALPDKVQPPVAPEDKKSDGASPDTGDTSDTLTRKQVSDASAYIRGLAQLRGRNAEWAERAVREAISLSAEEALKLKVIDVVAANVPELLNRLDGRKMTIEGSVHALDTAGVEPTVLEPDWRTRLLAIITDPSIAYMLILIGIYGLFFEFTNPGLVLPGVAGTICVLLALYGFQMLPVNYAGLALMLLGMCFMVAEAFFPAYGSLGIGGVIAFIIGSIMLVDTDGYGVPIALVIGIAVASAAFMIFVLGMALRSRRWPVVCGIEALVGRYGEAAEDCEAQGRVLVQGELWRAKSTMPLKAGQRVRVASIESQELQVVPEPESDKAPGPSAG